MMTRRDSHVRAFGPLYVSAVLTLIVLVSSAASCPKASRPTQTVAMYAGQVLSSTNQLARTAAGLADAKVLTVAQAAPIVIACDKLDTLGSGLATALQDVDAASTTDRPAKIAAVSRLIVDMRAILATVHVPPGTSQVVLDTVSQLASLFFQIEMAMGGLRG